MVRHGREKEGDVQGYMQQNVHEWGKPAHKHAPCITFHTACVRNDGFWDGTWVEQLWWRLHFAVGMQHA